MVVKRHIFTVITFVITALYPTVGMLFYFTNERFQRPIERIDDQVWVFIFKIFFLLSGFLNAITRLSEPYFYTTLYKGIKESLFSVGSKQNVVWDFLDRGLT